jgi:hypothetical protein
MGSQAGTGQKRRAAPVFLWLPAASLALGLLLGRVAPGMADDSRAAVESAVGDDQIQRDAPIRKSIADAETPDIQRDPPAVKPAPPPPEAHGISLSLGWLPYAILGLIGIGLIYLIARYISHRAELNPADGDRPADTATGTATYKLARDAEVQDHTFDEVDALAAQGAFAEAIHRLLLLVQERLRSHLEHGFQSSLTSREILRRAKLSGDAKTAFAHLVAAVEITLFGQQVANRATYELCRENSRRVLAAA